MWEATKQRRRALYADAEELIESEHASELTLGAVARRIGGSRRQLQRVFAEVGGTTFRSLLTAARMHAARELLTGTELPVAEVGRRVGYPRADAFSDAVQRHFGRPPTALREERAKPPGSPGAPGEAPETEPPGGPDTGPDR